MADDPQNLVLEHLRQIREEMGAMRSEIREVKADLAGFREETREDIAEVRHAVAGIAYALAHQQGQFSERIERLEEKAGI